jgi:hypothetical protein
VSGSTSGLYFVDFRTGEWVLLLKDEQGPHTPITVTPDNRQVVYGTYDGLEVIDVETRRTRVLVPGPIKPGEGGGATVRFLDWISGAPR